MSDYPDQFIEFANLLTQDQRAHLVEYMNKKLMGEILNAKDYEDISKYIPLVDSVASQLLPESSKRYNALLKQVSSETLKLIQDSVKEFNATNPYSEEESRLAYWKDTELDRFIDSSGDLFKEIKEIYTEADFPTSFYERRIYKYRKSIQKNKSISGALKESILAEWERRILEKKMAFELQVIDRMRAEFLKKLYDQMEMFKKLIYALSPLTNDLGRLWDLSRNVWQRTDLDILSKYAEFLESEESLRTLTNILGRMDSAEREMKEEERKEKVFETEWRTEYASKAELVGIHESDDLDNVIPSEVALLADKSAETYFFKKFAEKKLITWEYEAKILAEKESLSQVKFKKPEKKEKGPIIICVDTSGSMHGEPEAIAKAVAFAILRIALADNRACFLISFSTDIRTFKMNDLRESLALLIDFLKMSFHAGTDPEPALKEAIKQLQENKYKDADVLVISDFIMDDIPQSLAKHIEEAKSQKTKFHSLVISESANKKVLSHFDNNWQFDPTGATKIRELIIGVSTVTGTH